MAERTTKNTHTFGSSSSSEGPNRETFMPLRTSLINIEPECSEIVPDNLVPFTVEATISNMADTPSVSPTDANPRSGSTSGPVNQMSTNVWQQLMTQNQMLMKSIIDYNANTSKRRHLNDFPETVNKRARQEYDEISSVGSEIEAEDDEAQEGENLDKFDNLLEINDNDCEIDDGQDLLAELKDFIQTEDETGDGISKSLADLVNTGIRMKVPENKAKEILNKYRKPENCKNIKVSKVNSGIWKQIGRRTRDVDVKLQKTQAFMAKAICPLLYLTDKLMKSCEKKESMDSKKLMELFSLSRDSYKLMQVAFTDLTFKRRHFICNELQHKYRELSGEENPVTDYLFGDNVKDLVSKVDAEITVARKLGRKGTKKTPRNNTVSDSVIRTPPEPTPKFHNKGFGYDKFRSEGYNKRNDWKTGEQKQDNRFLGKRKDKFKKPT